MKRDKKGNIEICNEYISRVPRARIFNNKEIDESIQEACKEVLKLSMNRTDGFKNDEVMIVFDVSKLIVLYQIYGYNRDIKINYIEYNAILDLYHDDTILLIHNHPDDIRLSIVDISLLLGDGDINGCIAVVNNGKIYYMLKELESDNEMYNRLNRSLVTAIRNKSLSIKDAEDKIYNNSYKFKLKSGISSRRRV